MAYDQRPTIFVVPTLNEEPSVEKAVSGVLDAGAQVLVVDDGSQDQTCDIIERLQASRPGVHLMQRGRQLGLGSAYRDGFRWALRRGFGALGEMDADLSHDPADIPRLMAGIQTADLAIGSRYVDGGGVEDWPLSRRLLSRAGNAYVRLWTGLKVRDATAGFRLYRREVIEAIDLAEVSSEGYAFQIEMALRTSRLGFDIIEVPIIFTERRDGVSKMSRRIVAEALWRVPLWGVRRSD
ncbi:MAG: polyprenol monophosphomannose synthase [Euzebya sp.]